MSEEWYPVINHELCTDCGACIEKCKNGVFDKNIVHPTVIYPDGCVTNCRGCQELCPSSALSYFGDVGQPSCSCCAS